MTFSPRLGNKEVFKYGWLHPETHWLLCDCTFLTIMFNHKEFLNKLIFFRLMNTMQVACRPVVFFLFFGNALNLATYTISMVFVSTLIKSKFQQVNDVFIGRKIVIFKKCRSVYFDNCTIVRVLQCSKWGYARGGFIN